MDNLEINSVLEEFEKNIVYHMDNLEIFCLLSYSFEVIVYHMDNLEMIHHHES